MAKHAIVAADIGGTKTLFGLYTLEDSAGPRAPLETLEEARFENRDHADFDQALGKFLAGRPVVAGAFAVAGTVIDGRCRVTNLPWTLDAHLLGAALHAEIALLNDLEAAMLGLEWVAPDQLKPLQSAARDPNGPIAMLATGTGLGEAVAVPTSAGLRVLPSEGGHADFCARTAIEIELLRFLQKRHPGHVSAERVLSGAGLLALYEFAIEHGLGASDPETELALRTGADPGDVIARRAQARADQACVRALDLYVAAYGAEAGNLALKVLPTGGVFIAGATAEKLAERLSRGDFIQAFLDKGRMGPVLERIPVSLVLQPNLALLGARARAAVIYRSSRAG